MLGVFFNLLEGLEVRTQNGVNLHLLTIAGHNKLRLRLTHSLLGADHFLGLANTLADFFYVLTKFV